MPEMTQTEKLELELEQLSVLIKASEAWGPDYQKDPETHAKLIKLNASIERKMRDYFRGLKDRVVNQYINWPAYHAEILKNQAKQAASKKPVPDIDIQIFDPASMNPEDDLFSQAIHDSVLAGVTIGAQAGQKIYGMDLGLGPASQAIQQAAQTRVAELVGKKVLKDGTVVDNPNPKFSVTDTTVEEIRQAISTSLGMNESMTDAQSRVADIVGDPNRAQTIAATESVNAYNSGMLTFGDQSGATGKEWNTNGATDEICPDNADASPLAIDDTFPSGDDAPPAHPNCNCSMRLLYSNEYPDDGSGDSSSQDDLTDDSGM